MKGTPVRAGATVEVSASDTPDKIVSAVVNAAVQRPARSSGGEWGFKLMFGLIFVFGVVIYFREEVYTFTQDLHKYPILTNIENLQIHQWLGDQWRFASGGVRDEATAASVAVAVPEPAPAADTASPTRHMRFFS